MTKDTPQNTQKDVYRRTTDKIIAAIEAGAGDWEMPWHNTGDGFIRPVNASFRQALSGRECCCSMGRSTGTGLCVGL